jgi:SAM-dependent methyltransferase
VQNPMELYEQQLVPALFSPAAKVLLDYAKPQKGERVLDVACGTGIVSRQVAPMVGVEGSVTGLDITPAMLDVACSIPQSEGVAIEWREGNALSLPFSDRSFDLVLCQQGLQFFPDRVKALSEMRRVLVPQGRVLVSVQQALEHNPVSEMFNATLLKHAGFSGIALPFSMGDPQLLENLLTEAGFHNVEVIPFTHPVRYPSVSDFIRATILASGAAVPAMAALDDDAKSRLIEQVTPDVSEGVSDYVQDGTLVYPMAALIGRANA